MVKKATTVFRRLMDEEKLVVAPGAYDGLSAKIVERAGFKAVYITGFGTENSLLGLNDMGFASMTEFVKHGSDMASAVDIPVIHDSDVGFGNARIVYRATREWIKAGVAAIHIEDQDVEKKQCPAFETVGGPPRTLSSVENMVGRIQAAAQARDEFDPDFIIIGRTDADVTGSVDEMIKRLNAYLKAGADVAMPMRTTKENSRRLVKEIKGPVLTCGVAGLTTEEIEDLGYKIYIAPTNLLRVAERAMIDGITEFKGKGTFEDYFKRNPPLSSKEHWDMLGNKKLIEMEKKYIRP